MIDTIITTTIIIIMEVAIAEDIDVHNTRYTQPSHSTRRRTVHHILDHHTTDHHITVDHMVINIW